MRERAFLIAGDQAALIANDISDMRYRAALLHVPVGMQVPVRRHESAETLFYIASGTLEFMAGGAVLPLTGPDHVRVPPGMVHAWRNVGNETAHVLVRTSRPAPAFRMIHACIEYAA